MTNPTPEIDTSNHGLRLNLNMLHNPADALARGEGLFVHDESAKAAIKAATDAPDKSSRANPDQIYRDGIYYHATLARVARIKGLAKIGLAASDTMMNVDLHDCGYAELFEVICVISNELIDEIEKSAPPQKA